MRLILVRHAEYEGVSWAQAIGWTDSPLNARGKAQAVWLGKRLRRLHIHAAYTSDLNRAVQTLQAVLAHQPKLRARHRRALRERNLGTLEGKSRDTYAQVLARSGLPGHEFQPRRGESWIQVRKRLIRFIGELRRNHRNQTVLIVSHGGTMSVILLHLFGAPWEQLRRFRSHPNTGVTVVDIRRGGRPRIRAIRDISHLPPELRPPPARLI